MNEREHSTVSIYDFTMKQADGSQKSLSDYRGKVLLIVNTATGCGFTPQYEGLEKLHGQYHDQGLEILDFPCDQFGHQAPGTDAEITAFCQLHYATSFPQFSKIEVNGAKEAPLYTFLKKERGGVLGSAIKWNFTKYLVDRSGRVVGRFAPTVTPAQLEEKIRQLL